MTDLSTARSRQRSAPGLVHQGVLYRDPAELVDLVAPELLAGLARGETVAAIVDDETRDHLCARIGPAAARIAFTPPNVAFAEQAQTMVARRRREAASVCVSGPLTVIGQFQPWMAPHDVAFWESMFNLVLAELPVRLMCACPADAGPATGIIATTHPELLTSAGAVSNERFGDPLGVLAAHPQPAPPRLGAPTGERTFSSPRDLAALRSAVTAHAQVAGLRPDRVDEVVLAVSEIASDCIEYGAGSGRLLMWAGGGELTWEVHDPGRPGAPDDARHTPARLGLSPPATSDHRGRGMWVSRELCDGLHMWHDGAAATVRGTVCT